MRRGLFERSFHLFFALGVVGNYWLFEAGGDLHEWVGWGIGVLVILRLAWGLLKAPGAGSVRFRFQPSALFAELRELGGHYQSQDGYSVAGSWMIVVMMTLAAALALTGWMQDLDAFWGEEWLQDTHEWLGHGLMTAAGVHIFAVLFIQIRHGVPLVRRMWFG